MLPRVEFRMPTSDRARRSSLAQPAHVLLVLAFVSGWSAPTQARRSGLAAAGCEGCHGVSGAQVEVSAEPSVFAPGDDVTFSIRIRRSEGTASVAGVYMPGAGVGQLRAISGEGLVLTTPESLMHSTPKAAQSGVVTFRFGWTAPAQVGSVQFDVYALAGNGDGRSGGDAAGVGLFQGTFGCAPQIFHTDFDQDGFGSAEYPTKVGCMSAAAPEGFASKVGDCNENNAAINPLAVEKCNGKDDNCNGMVDENAVIVEMWPDEDRDGYYAAKTGTPMMGCGDIPGYAADPGDCSPRDPKVHPGATEICNLFDDNCNSRVDERLRPQCGLGFCRAQSFTCNPDDCVPSLPTAERCNLLDDDCDGETDEGDLCAAGQRCELGKCEAGSYTPGPSTTPPAGGSASATGGVPGAPAGGAPGTGAGGAPSASTGGVSAGAPASSSASAGCSAAPGRSPGAAFAMLLLALFGLRSLSTRRPQRPAR